MSHEQLSNTREITTGGTPVEVNDWVCWQNNTGLKVAGETIASAADSATITVRTSPYARMTVAVGILTVIALVAALYLARAFFVPLLIGILASYTLSPVVDWLKVCRLPRSVTAALVLLVLAGSLSWIAFSLSDDAAAMIDKFPEAARKLRQNLSDTRTGPTA